MFVCVVRACVLILKTPFRKYSMIRMLVTRIFEKISILRTRTCGHAFTARKCSCIQDGFRADRRCLLSVNPLVSAELFFTILYPNVMLIKSLCSNLDMCVNLYASTYSQLRILFADRDRKWVNHAFRSLLNSLLASERNPFQSQTEHLNAADITHTPLA